MKIVRVASPKFLLWKFLMGPGDVKEFNRREMERNTTAPASVLAAINNTTELPFDKLVTLNSVAVFVSGRFHFIKDGYQPTLKVRGDGGDSWAFSTTGGGFKLVGLDDINVYHCLLPRDRKSRFWNRQLYHLLPGTDYEREHFARPADVNYFLYLADGEVSINGLNIEGPQFFEVGVGDPHDQLEIVARRDSLLLKLWLDAADL